MGNEPNFNSSWCQFNNRKRNPRGAEKTTTGEWDKPTSISTRKMKKPAPKSGLFDVMPAIT